MPPATAKEKTVLPLSLMAKFAFASKVKLTAVPLTVATMLIPPVKVNTSAMVMLPRPTMMR